MLESTSESVQDITVYHVGELLLPGFKEKIEPLPNPDGARTDLTRTLSLLAASRAVEHP